MKKIPVNHSILKWARESLNISLVEVAQKMNKSIEIIESWENGENSPTYLQLEKLAYNIYKRPIAIFFFPEPPEEVTPKKSFRTLPEFELKVLSPSILKLFRQAQAMQININELCEGRNPASKRIFEDIDISINVNINDLTKIVRNYLGIPLEEQLKWKDVDEALRGWRELLERYGIFVFKDSFKQEEISGFCLYNSKFPVIYINNYMPKTRQIFTLFHELAHILFKTGGIDKVKDTYIKSLSKNNKIIEIKCNKFAGDFLVPDKDFDKQISTMKIEDNSIITLSKRYNVSREVILRKLLNRKIIDENYYNKKANQWIEDAKKIKKRKKEKSKGGDYYATKAVYLGKNYLNLVFFQYYRNHISIYQLADYLNVKVNYITNLELAFSKSK